MTAEPALCGAGGKKATFASLSQHVTSLRNIQTARKQTRAEATASETKPPEDKHTAKESNPKTQRCGDLVQLGQRGEGISKSFDREPQGY